MIDERDANAPYWPGDFKIGDRVRVRLSGECQKARLWDGDLVGHHSDEDGQTGRIIIWPFDTTPRKNHVFAVRFDHPPYIEMEEGPKGFLRATTYAATELELLERADV